MLIEVLKRTWPEWQVEGPPLGRGSFGTVFQAVRRTHNVESHAAIKIISIPADSSEIDSLQSDGLDPNATRTYLQNLVNDFVSEIQLMEKLKGIQNVVSVEDYEVVEKADELGWYILIRMELLTPFNKYSLAKPLTEADVIKLGCDICTALEICQSCNIIHRDIKPENIFINDFGHFKLGDFGIARKIGNLSGGLSQKGTFNYMAPEIANSSCYDARADLYSLGIVLYKLMNNNRLPFLETEQQLLNPNERRKAVERRIQGEPLPPPSEASQALSNVILCACAYDPNRRFSTATAMKRALEQIGSHSFSATPWPTRTKAEPVHSAPAHFEPTPAPERKTPMPHFEPTPTPKPMAAPVGGSFFKAAGNLGAPRLSEPKVSGRRAIRDSEREETASIPVPPAPTVKPMTPVKPMSAVPPMTPVAPKESAYSASDELEGTVRVRRAPAASDPHSGFGKKHK